MQFGDRNTLAIELHPLSPSWERAYPPERTAWSTFALWVGGENLCRNILDGTETVRDGVNIPLASLADWLVRSWAYLAFEERPSRFPPRPSPVSTLRSWGDAPPPRGVHEDDWIEWRESWWSHHFLAAGADGAQLPSVAFLRSADVLCIEWAPSQFAGARAPTFLAQRGQVLVPWEKSEGVLSEFVAFVGDWLRREGLVELYSWVRREAPLGSADASFLDLLAIYTGRDEKALFSWTRANSEAELRERLGLRVDTRDPGGSVVTQVLRDLPPEVSPGIEAELLALHQRTSRGRGFDPAMRHAARDAAGAGESPEESGYLAAAEVRHQIALNGQPVGDLDSLLGSLEIDVVDSGVECARERMLLGAWRGGSASAVINSTPRTRVSWGRRFELGRALGQLLIGSFRLDAIGGASSAYSQSWMRRCSGAFAAELLLPTAGIHARDLGNLDSAADPDAFRALMHEYGVGARTAAYQLWNHGLLSSPEIRDDLIDRFGSPEV